MAVKTSSSSRRLVVGVVGKYSMAVLSVCDESRRAVRGYITLRGSVRRKVVCQPEGHEKHDVIARNGQDPPTRRLSPAVKPYAMHSVMAGAASCPPRSHRQDPETGHFGIPHPQIHIGRSWGNSSGVNTGMLYRTLSTFDTP